MTQSPIEIVNEYLDGVYYDASVGECYTYSLGVDDGDTVVKLSDPVTEEYVESLSLEEFKELEPDLFPVPEEAVRDPVNYFEREVSKRMANTEFDTGFIYANSRTEVVERDTE